MSPTHTPHSPPHSQSRPQRSTPTARSTARTPASVGQTLSPGVAATSARTPSDRMIKEPKGQSPSYFGLTIESAQDTYGSNEAAQQVRSNWTPPTSNVRSTAAASPHIIPLDQNPEFEAFKKASEMNKFNFANNLGRPSFGSLSGFSHSTRSSVDSGRTGLSMAPPPLSREHSSAGAKPVTDEKNTHQRSPKRLLSSPVPNITDRPRRNSPASFDDRHEEIARQVARFANDEWHANPHANQSLPPLLKDAGRTLSHHRAETLPNRFDGEDSQDPSRNDGPVIVTPQHVVGLLDASNEDILLLDLRVSTQYARSRITGALNLCIPTTLLKRPSFNVQKLAETFKDPEQRSRFERWRNSRYIIVYDASTAQMKDAMTCVNTLKKFATEGWTGYSYIIRGGFQEFGFKFPSLIASGDATGLSSTSTTLVLDADRPAVAPVVGGCPMPTTKTAANPFFGNIRQNMDLIGGVGQMSIKHPANLTQRIEESLPEWVRKAADPRDNGKLVADKFFNIEKREQKRMQEALSGTVSYGTPGGKVQIAGIEKGNKNRYNNIWPYEHSRVKIQGVPHGECDYVNANHVKASLTGKRYIATQGPIPATFADFWNMVWQQDIRVIVMLTAEKEGGQVKAHKYWDGGDYGNLKLNYLSEHRASLEPERIHRHYSNHRDRAKDQKQGARRATVTANPPALKEASSPVNGAGEQPYVIVRRFSLSRSDRPFERMREITQLQYSHWPDFGAPAHPAHLLGLVEQCDAVVRQSQGLQATATAGEKERADQRPILVHCSAGCGRTGTFCTVDSVVDMLKKQRKDRKQSRGTREATPMDLDNSLSPRMSSRMSIDASDPDKDDIDLVERTVEEFRLQRLSMVQSLRQFVLCYETVLEWLAEQNPKTA
ncbi:hypothetical protein NA57DRAFT_40868 [Rhizodiscina lignyota]|uniref:protein-tyrosine-phosphatase n=1 Tax=Rhizodiscina lignyota TaxID=1504668 RepID=A0A9P4I9X9_9PEZI|nr:hypothetical protein NA57DRAFT_40868 [Rhizodiscina lignyota]